MKMITKIGILLATCLIVALGYMVYSPNYLAIDLDRTAANVVNDTTAAIDNATIGVINDYSDQHHAKTMEEIESIKNGTNATNPSGTVTPTVHNATTKTEAMNDLAVSMAKDEASVGYEKTRDKIENVTANKSAMTEAADDFANRVLENEKAAEYLNTAKNMTGNYTIDNVTALFDK